MKENPVKVWLQQIRAPFLVLSVVLVMIGIGVAFADGVFSWPKSGLLVAGVILAHISVNLFNELSDFKTKIDEHTTPTPFSGGSGMLQKGYTTAATVGIVAYSTLFLSAIIGIYFCMTGSWYIFIIMAVGGLTIRFYTSFLARWLLGEFFSGLTLGTFVVLGSYLALTGHLTTSVIIISLPPGILTFLLLFLNEFPDADADKKGGRYHLIIHLGKKNSVKIYLTGLFITYCLIMIMPLAFEIRRGVWFALLTLPLALKAGLIAFKHHSDNQRLVPAQAMNVVVVIITDLLLALAFFF